MIKCGVLFEVRAEVLNIIYTSFSFKGLNILMFFFPMSCLMDGRHLMHSTGCVASSAYIKYFLEYLKERKHLGYWRIIIKYILRYRLWMYGPDTTVQVQSRVNTGLIKYGQPADLFSYHELLEKYCAQWFNKSIIWHVHLQNCSTLNAM
jgi:hypothetical protein